MTFVVRAVGEPLHLVPRHRAAVAEVDQNLPTFSFKTLDDYVSEALWLPKLNMTFVSIFSGVAGILAMIGIYGITAYSVRQRTHEIGIRMALGASAGKVLWLVIRRGLVLIMSGTLFGLAAALALTRVMRTVLWGIVAATDALTFGTVILGLASVSLWACYLPARRALRIEPTVACGTNSGGPCDQREAHIVLFRRVATRKRFS